MRQMVTSALMLGATLLAGPVAWSEQSPIEALSHLLAGDWRCSGHFANGKTISSSESFAPILKSEWLREEHLDDPPFGYAAHSLWGWDSERRFYTLTIFDNFGGMRLFTSPGWQDATLTFETRQLLAPPTRQERFVYHLRAVGGYSVEYQVLDKTNTWKMGDVLECTPVTPRS